MNQVKIGAFLKELRKENKLTQDELADKLNVSRRTVSRWETGNNMPDIELLIILADLYDVNLREILNGERNESKMNRIETETAILTQEYTNESNEKIKKVYHLLFIASGVFGTLSLVINYLELKGHFWDFASGLGVGMMFGSVLLGALYTSKVFATMMENLKKAIK